MENRELGPELTAEGWIAIGDELLWCHPPSRRTVNIGNNWKRNQCSGCLVLPCEPESPETVGCTAGWSRRDEFGNPIFRIGADGRLIVADNDGGLVWTEHWADALRIGREMRRRILAERPVFEPSKQLNFDDLLERKA